MPTNDPAEILLSDNTLKMCLPKILKVSPSLKALYVFLSFSNKTSLYYILC